MQIYNKMKEKHLKEPSEINDEDEFQEITAVSTQLKEQACVCDM